MSPQLTATSSWKVYDMGVIDKVKDRAEDSLGKAKDVVGAATNQGPQAEGETGQAAAGLNKVGENAPDIR